MIKKILEKQNKDLRVRLENAAVKAEIALTEYKIESDKLQNQIRNQNDVITMLQRDIAMLESSNAELKNNIKLLKAELEKSQDMAEKYRAMCMKDSKTSSKPPSTDGFKKPHVFSCRTKSGKKRGGQPGHPGYTLKLFENPTTIKKKEPPKTCKCGGEIECGEEYTAKQQVDVVVMPIITEERVYTGSCQDCGCKYKGEFSEGYVNPVQYGAGLKAVVASLNAHANVTNNKTSEFLNSVTDGRISISDGTVVNIIHELSQELDETMAFIRSQLIASRILFADETGCHVNGSLNWMQIYCNDEYTLFGRNEKRGSFLIEGYDILLLFTGVLVHDHFKSYYRYENISHAECNVHILRYLEAVIQIQKHAWAKELADFLRETLHMKKEIISAGGVGFDAEKKADLCKRYIEILNTGDIELAAAMAGKTSTSYFDDERCLLARLREYKDEHLMFIMDFDVPFDNNRGEHGARFLKSKKKSSCGFRSDKGADDYARVASLIATLRKQKQCIFGTIKDLFNGISPAFITQAVP